MKSTFHDSLETPIESDKRLRLHQTNTLVWNQPALVKESFKLSQQLARLV
ncbi:hypothetical protein Psal006b_01533 [Piscirickettsia salmonis]|uniref:Uncharacterized protein n=1 Tax=Piscirickettsia salmonis TaxID=1238 RepID=A0AAC8VI76_PISSA|nr:hypothetical protein KU39_1674 [Piscirickettsia salmonis]QGN98540.1 hypothetical protein Psal006b_01533 [Piscirickettsia salmonis]QGO02159.1 hypothetical protein Psal008_01546 [Piscirickettsia salmonis]QGO12848.1 hypothetical protein Psal010b_01531 [Piscirickettsia salmonis]QGO19890.1 hypothetical protein Psal013_01543 [Piscirickettsia salmonis]